jgi:sialate O-acetylesterase
MRRSIILRISLAWLLFTPIARADIKVAPVIGDDMVLQRGTSVPIWGTATPHERVTVTFQQQHVDVVADDLGQWQVRLSPLTASAEPAAMTIRGENDILVLKNILVGEVWLVSGQSNMEFPMVGFPALGVHPPLPIQHRLQSDLTKADCANVRLLRMALDGAKPTGQTDGWQVCDSASMAPFSAVGFYFAQELGKKLGVPIGILEAAVGGTRIEPWTPARTPEETSALRQRDENKNDSADTGSLYTKLIKPLAPYALRGVLWYQGEANVLAPGADAYSEKMRDLIQGWRKAWDRPNLPFEYALLAPMRYTMLKIPNLTLTEQSLPQFWDQQIKALAIPHTSLISVDDLVDISRPEPGQNSLAYIMNLIHPGDKWDVAHRFVLIALAKEYGFSNIVSSGPTVQRIARQGNGLKIDFANADCGLVSRDGKALTGFEVAGADMQFHPAAASLVGHSVIVTSREVAQPMAIRFSWTETSQPNLFNCAGLPAIPFYRKLSASHHR